MVRTLPRTFCQWKSPPKLICSIWTSFDRKISLDPPIVSSLGWLKLLIKSVSNLISGVKNFESHTASLLRAVPLSQVQSAYAKGTDGSGFSVFVGSVAGGAPCELAATVSELGAADVVAGALAFDAAPAATAEAGADLPLPSSCCWS